MRELAEYQQNKLGELYEKSSHELALAIQQTYRHVFYPSRNRIEGAEVDLAHTVVDVQTASNRPGDGQKQVVTQLQNINKLRLSSDQPDSPTYVRDRTPLKKGQITTAKLRSEFREDPTLPMLVGDDIFVRGIRVGIEQGEYIYKSGSLLLGKGDPYADVKIDEQSMVFTAAYAREHKIWPRPAPEPASRPGDKPDVSAGQLYPSQRPADTAAHMLSTFIADDVLRAALTRVVEDALKAQMRTFSRLIIRPFDSQDALKLLSVVNAVSNAAKSVQLSADFETTDKSVISVNFQGSLNEALPLKDYLEPQLRAATEKNLSCTYELAFDPPFALAGDQPQKLIERLARIVSTSAEVMAYGNKN